MSKKLGTDFSANINKELYDFTGNSNYLLCYDSNLDYYAILNMNSGSIMERSNGQVYDGYLEYKCYYAGFNSYFYEKDNTIYSINNVGERISVDDALLRYKEYSDNLMNTSIEESVFKNREDIRMYVDKELRKEESREGIPISKCGRDKANYSDDVQYNTFVLCNSMYRGPVGSNPTCYVDGYRIGFSEFTKYDGSTYYDTLFPVNQDGTCGIVAATMLLQYYERHQLLNTVSSNIYSQANTSLTDGARYSSSAIVLEILHDKIAEHHSNGGSGSTYVTVKNAINKYFSANSISGMSATSSASWWGLKSAIDNGDPCIVFVGLCNLYYVNNDLDTYTTESLGTDGHAMYTYGYTLTSLNVVDEYICHAGWTSTAHFYSMTYVAKTAIAGNVRLSY